MTTNALSMSCNGLGHRRHVNELWQSVVQELTDTEAVVGLS